MTNSTIPISRQDRVADDWRDYDLLATGDGERVERWGKLILVRPDPQVLWPYTTEGRKQRALANAVYLRSAKGGGEWKTKTALPESWPIAYRNYQFEVRPTGFKHTGLFPEQAVNWNWMHDIISQAGRSVQVLNLFAYTGAATVAAAKAGAELCHVDAAKSIVRWARENAARSGLREHPIRYIVDDVLGFVNREYRRKRKYDAVIMDPPSYGRGSKGETWKIEKHLYPLLEACKSVLSDNPLFFLINSYTTGLAPSVLGNTLASLLTGSGGSIQIGEVGLPIRDSGLVLPCGTYARWEA